MKQVFFVLMLLALQVHAQRNVILIIADDLGTDYFGFYEDHQDTVDVPNIRSLLSRGIRFKNAMSNPVCSSTRAGILTGRYSFRTGVGGIVGGIGGSNPLDTSEVTIPRLLKIFNPNIAKANIGKWHLHGAMPVGNLLFPNKMGYDHFEGPFIGQLPSYTNWTKYTDGVASTVTNYATSENVDNAVAWMKQQSGKPIFLWLAFNAPHAPLHLPPAGLYSIPNLTGTQPDINAHPKEYFKADIQALDHEIGRMFDSLQVMNRLDSTDFIFIGDNGNTAMTAQIADVNKAKGTVYQYGVHVPFMIAGPAVVNPGRESDALINTADIFATVLDLFGDTDWPSHIPVNKPVDSRSIMPIIKDNGASVRPWSFCEDFKLTPDSTDGKAMRNMEYKLIQFDYGAQEFYHLSTDPGETSNLLNGALNATELSNYNYLCNEMTNLVGSGSYCNASVDVQDVQVAQGVRVYPNPFSSHLFIDSEEGGTSFELINSMGQLVDSGRQIEAHDFSGLVKGVYLLKVVGSRTVFFKLVKE